MTNLQSLGLAIVLLGAVAVVQAGATQAPAAQGTPSTTLVRFSTDAFWLNLHHFLYVLGRARAGQPDARREGVVGAPAEQESTLSTLTRDDQEIWRDAVAFYAGGLSKRDAVFDQELVEITGALARVGEAPALQSDSAVPSTVADALARAAPIYRKAWWPAHHRANLQWTQETKILVDRYGSRIVEFLTLVYQMSWPAEGYPVYVCAYANWAGAYSTDGPLIVISSRAEGMRGPAGLETLFHEASHQWDTPVMEKLAEIGRSMGTQAPNGLTHAMIWMTAGDAVRRLIPGYVPFAEAGGVWQRGPNPRLRPLLDAAWMPYLKGSGTRDEALTALLKLAGRSGGMK